MIYQTSNFILALVVGIYSSFIYLITIKISDIQPMPFIDEIFHIPQAQSYCRGNFSEWNPKITTLPGLYLFSVGLHQIWEIFTGSSECTVLRLRMINAITGMLIFPTIFLYLNLRHLKEVGFGKVLLAALNLSLFPVLHWFNYLYYTDVLSTLLVLLMFLMHSYGASKCSALLGFLSVVTRQTNIVWVAFILALQGTELLRLLKVPLNRNIVNHVLGRITPIHKLLQKFCDCLQFLKWHLYEMIPLTSVMVGFIIFILINGSIVVGDKDRHEATVNLPQIGYFVLYFLFFSPFYAVSHIQHFLNTIKNHWIITIISIAISITIIHMNTIVHPYMLADNRHYIFYVWKRFYEHLWFRYGIIPAYIFGFYVCLQFLKKRDFLFLFFYFVCSFATFVPQKLLEMRYFIIPFIIARLQFVSRSWKVLIAEFIYFVVINLYTLWIFQNKTFMWHDLNEPQRIIW